MSGSSGVKIPISADASAVVNSFREITQLIDKAGQSGKALADVDLSHPELRDFAEDIRRVTQNLEDLKRVGRGTTAAAWRTAAGAAGTHLGGIPNAIFAQYPNQQTAQRALAQGGSYVLNGTQWAPPPPPPPPQSPHKKPSATGELGDAASAASGLLTSLMGPAKFLLAAAGMQGAAHLASKAIGNASDESMGNDRLGRIIGDSADDFDRLRDSVRDATKGLQLTYGEAQRLAEQWAKLGGYGYIGPDANGGASNMMNQIRDAVGWGRSVGIDPSHAVANMAKADALQMNPREFADLIGETVAKGALPGKTEDVMDSILRWAQRSTSELGDHTSAAEFAAMYAGMNGSQYLGLRGKNAEEMIGSIDGAIRQGGTGGDASMALTLVALKNSGITNPNQARYQMQGGAFAQLPNGQLNYQAIQAELDRLYPRGAKGSDQYWARLQAVSQMYFGGDMRKAESFDHFRGPVDVQRAQKVLGDRLNQVNASGLDDIAKIASADDLERWRKNLLGRKGPNGMSDWVTGDERKRLEDPTLTGEKLRDAMIGLVGEHGMGGTEGSALKQSLASLDNAITAAGTGLIPVLTDVRGGLAYVGDQLGRLSEILGKGYESSRGTGGFFDQMGNWIDGKGVGSIGGTASVHPGSPDAYRGMVADAANKYGIPVALLTSLIQHESSWDPHARSATGALGLTQMLPSTALKPGYGMQGINPDNLMDPATSIDEGAHYLSARAKSMNLNLNDPMQAYRALMAYHSDVKHPGSDEAYATGIMNGAFHNGRWDQVPPDDPTRTGATQHVVTGHAVVTLNDPKGNKVGQGVAPLTSAPTPKPTGGGGGNYIDVGGGY